jgi:hypothetical protein
MNYQALFAVVVVLVSVGALVQADPTCGVVYDGLAPYASSSSRFDLATQTSTSTIAAHWFGFGDDVLNYEWAVASAAQLPSLPGMM